MVISIMSKIGVTLSNNENKEIHAVYGFPWWRTIGKRLAGLHIAIS
jgi:hypothetical protein